MTDNVEINYDKHGAEKSVVVPYDLYVEMLAAKNDYDDLKNRLNQLFYILSDVVAQPAPAEPEEIDTPEDVAFDANTEIPSTVPETQEITEQRDIRYYQRARGLYVDSKRFCVLAGSKARGTPSDTFNSIDSLSDLRDRLISASVLKRDHEWGDYEFARDYTFGSPSAAASVVDGNSRSGPQSWGRPRTY